MAARTKRRAQFDFRGRPFLWWVDGDRYLRVASSDKKFVIAVPLGTDGGPPLVEVIGQEFPGLDRSERRPIWLVVPEQATTSMGGWVDRLLRWAFDPAHELICFEGPPRFL
jgi:hypothetical protein